jgi:hypothetical protein
MTTGSATIPKKLFGKPSKFACHVFATVAQFITTLTEQLSTASGFFASSIASTDNTKAAIKLPIAPTSILVKIHRLSRLLVSLWL